MFGTNRGARRYEEALPTEGQQSRKVVLAEQRGCPETGRRPDPDRILRLETWLSKKIAKS